MPHWRFVRGLAEHWHQVRAELSLVVPCEVGGTAEWAVSRPSPHWISSGDSSHSSPAVFFLLASLSSTYSFSTSSLLLYLYPYSKKKKMQVPPQRGRRRGLLQKGLF